MGSLPLRFFIASALALTLNGCVSGGLHLFQPGPGARFSGANENQTVARIEHICSDYSIGDQKLGALLASDSPFLGLTLGLYRGEMSNDQYVERVLSLHPAADGNVPATGCVIAQINNCLRGGCGLKSVPEGMQQGKPEDKPAGSIALSTGGTSLTKPEVAAGGMSRTPELDAER